jgi:hypothetical protein
MLSIQEGWLYSRALTLLVRQAECDTKNTVKQICTKECAIEMQLVFCLRPNLEFCKTPDIPEFCKTRDFSSSYDQKISSFGIYLFPNLEFSFPVLRQKKLEIGRSPVIPQSRVFVIQCTRALQLYL